MFERGQIVISEAGRDKARLLTVVHSDSHFVYVCDGKERPLDNPKRKNPKHLRMIGMTLQEDQLRSDKALRKALAIVSSDTEQGGQK